MLKPVELANFLLVFASAALVIVCGALYALFFAIARIEARRVFLIWAYVAGAGLIAAVLMLGFAANLFVSTLWFAIVLLMLIGYLVAPHAIWHLCLATHGESLHPIQSKLQQRKG